MESLVVPIVGILVGLSATVAILIQWLRAFYTHPIQATIRALVGLLALLVGSMSVPEIHGNMSVSLDWGAFLTVRETDLTVSTGASLASNIVAWSSVTILLGISLLLVPRKVEASATDLVDA